MSVRGNNPNRASSNNVRLVSSEISAMDSQITGQNNHQLDGRSQNPFIERQGAFNFQAGHFRSLSHGQALNQGFIPARLNFLTGAAEIALPQQNRQSHGDQPPNSQAEHDFVIDFGGDTGATVNTATTHDTNNNGHRTREQNPINSLRSLWKASEGSLPFIFLLLIKILYDHRLGKGHFHYLSLLV